MIETQSKIKGKHTVKRTAKILLACEKCGNTFRQVVSRVYEKNYCSRECRIVPMEDRFWAKVKVVDDVNSCWEWQGSLNKQGYGSLSIKYRKTSLAHRVSWEIHHKESHEGLLVCHTCDNPKCVRPTHLFLGTHTDNMRDMARKGRKAPPNIDTAGINHARCTLTEDQVRQILAMGKAKMRGADIARIIGIPQARTRAIITRKTWKHIE